MICNPKYITTVHIFEAKSSPSSATFCLHQTAQEFGDDPWLVNIVLNNFYVDDCLISVNATEESDNYSCQCFRIVQLPQMNFGRDGLLEQMA